MDRHVHTSPESPAFQVLVVEDDALLRAVAVEYLEEYGYSVLEAETADEACLMLRANGRIGVVFTDIELKGRMTGFDLARWIGREHTDVRVLLTSGHVAAAQLQGRQLVTKPYALDEVERQLRGLIHCRSSRRNRGASSPLSLKHPTGSAAMKCFPFVAVSVCFASLVACSIKEERVVQPAPAPAVVTPVPPGSVVYTQPAPATTTVYTTR